MKNSCKRGETAMFIVACIAVILCLGGITNVSVIAQTAPDSPILFQIGQDKYSFDDVNKVCIKNSNGKRNLKTMRCDSVKQFIELYYTYCLKLKDAENRNYEKDPAVKHEIENNRKIVAENYYFDKFVATPNVETMVNRRGEEKEISYMMFAFPPAPSTDTVATYRLAMSVLQQLQNGEDFAVLATKYSDDKPTAMKGGLLEDWVTSGKMDRRMEDAMYSIKIGQYYPHLVKLPKFGYFIIKLENSKKRSFVKFSHILISQSGSDDSSVVASKAMADSVYKLIKDRKISFGDAAKKFSDDNATAVKGGSFDDWYSRSDGFLTAGGKTIPAFEDAVFKLDVGDISEPVKTMYGWHIIRCDSARGVNYDEEREAVKSLYRRIFYTNDKRAYLDSIKNVMGFKLNTATFNELIASVDTNKTNLDSSWNAKMSGSLYSKTLFSFNSKNYKVSDITDLMKKPGEFRGLPTNPEGFSRAIQLFVDPKVINSVTANLETEYPEFKDLITEFRNGTLIFKVENDEIWENTPFDSVAAHKYYKDNLAKFVTDTLYDVQEVMLVRETDAKDMYNKLKNGTITFDEAAEKYTQRSGYREIKGKLYEVNPKKHKIAEIVHKLKIKEGEFTEPQRSDNGYSIIKVNKIHYPRQKTYKEAFGDIAPVIQDMTHKNKAEKWISGLKKKYKLVVNDNIIDSICK